MLRNPNFNPEMIATKSYAASSLCAWVVNMVKYHHIRCEVCLGLRRALRSTAAARRRGGRGSGMRRCGAARAAPCLRR